MLNTIRYSYKDADGDVLGPFSPQQIALEYRKGRVPPYSKIVMHSADNVTSTVELKWLIEDNGSDNPFPQYSFGDRRATSEADYSGFGYGDIGKNEALSLTQIASSSNSAFESGDHVPKQEVMKESFGLKNFSAKSETRSNIPIMYYYWNSRFEKKGPYKVDYMLKCYENGNFKNDPKLKLHLTDNESSKKDSVNCQITLEELVRIFGSNNPFPKYQSECKARLPKYNNAKRGVSVFGKAVERIVEQPRKSEDTPVTSTRRSFSNQVLPIKTGEHLPFFGVLNNVPSNTSVQLLPFEMVVDLASGLSIRFDKMSRDEKYNLYSKLELLGLPNECKVCSRKIGRSNDYIPHVLSISHLKKTTETIGLKYSLEYDYAKLRDMMINSKIVKLLDLQVEPPQIIPPSSNIIQTSNEDSQQVQGKRRSRRRGRRGTGNTGNNETIPK